MTSVTTSTSSSTLSKEDFASFHLRWKELARTKQITRIDSALRIIVLNQNPLASMPPTKNPARLANGARFCSGLYLAFADLSHILRTYGNPPGYAFTPEGCAELKRRNNEVSI